MLHPRPEENMKYFLVTVSLFMGLSVAHSTEPQPRHYYGAKLEPVRHVLHGAGQGRAQDVKDYSKAIDPYGPSLFMDYCGVKKAATADYASSLKKKLAGFPNYTVVQLGLSMTNDGKPEERYEHEVADGKYDEQLEKLLKDLKQLGVPIYIRIGYECNGPWNGYQPESYKKAFRHITQMIRKCGINAATVWCPHPNDLEQAMNYYPGDEWVDWWAVDIFSSDQIQDCKPLIAEAHKHNKPVMIGESTPRYIGVLDGEESWRKWFEPYFELIRTSPGIKAFCYINWNWAEKPRWAKWGDARLQQNKIVSDLYKKEMSSSLYQHASTKEAFEKSLDFRPERHQSEVIDKMNYRASSRISILNR